MDAFAFAPAIEFGIAPVVYLMDKPVFHKKSKSTEEGRLVHRVKSLFHFCQGEGITHGNDFLHYHYPYCSWSYACAGKYLFNIIHTMQS